MDTSVAYRLEALEKFMEAVAKMLGCLPSYCDSHPDRGNAHIIERLRHLTSKSTRPDNAERFHCAMCGGPIKHVKHGQLILISGGRKDDIGEL